MHRSLLAIAVLTCLLLVGTACLLDDSDEEFMAYCTDRYGLDESTRDCQCYWEEMRQDDISPGDIVRLFRNDNDVDLRAGLSARRANERCFR